MSRGPAGALSFETGDLFTSGADALVNPVNCAGAMGAGLALEFKKRWPSYFADYQQACRSGKLLPGTVHHYVLTPPTPFVIFSVPTKSHWRDKSLLLHVTKGLFVLARQVRQLRGDGLPLDSIAVPALGCGLGGLAWDDVKEATVDLLSPLAEDGVRVLVFPPQPSMRRSTPESDVAPGA